MDADTVITTATSNWAIEQAERGDRDLALALANAAIMMHRSFQDNASSDLDRQRWYGIELELRERLIHILGSEAETELLK